MNILVKRMGFKMHPDEEKSDGSWRGLRSKFQDLGSRHQEGGSGGATNVIKIGRYEKSVYFLKAREEKFHGET